jgi:hypothetical protein
MHDLLVCFEKRKRDKNVIEERVEIVSVVVRIISSLCV